MTHAWHVFGSMKIDQIYIKFTIYNYMLHYFFEAYVLPLSDNGMGFKKNKTNQENPTTTTTKQQQHNSSNNNNNNTSLLLKRRELHFS